MKTYPSAFGSATEDKTDSQWNQLFYIVDPKAPLIAIFISEFRDYDVVPIGYNLTIVCIGKKSREGDSHQFSEQPFRVELFFRKHPVKLCGSLHSDRNDTKRCVYRIEKATKKNSGEYGCMVTNFMECSTALLTLHLRGKFDNLVYWVSISELLNFILNSFND